MRISKVLLDTYLTERQREAFQTITRDELGGCVFARVGEGKTRVSLFAAIELIPERERATAIVVFCRRIAFDDWRFEAEKLMLDAKVVEIEDVVPGMAFMENTIVLCSHGKLLSPITVATLQKLYIDAVIVDEAYLFANPQSKRSKVLAKLYPNRPRITLSGSLMPSRDLIQIYAQVAAAGRGKALAEHATAFRSKYQIGIQERHYCYYPKKGAYAAIMERISPFTYVYLPRSSSRIIKDSILKVTMTKEQQAYIAELKATYAIEGKFELKSAASVIQKAQQISNGWLKDDKGEVTYFPSTKAQRCTALVEEILNSSESKVVIWCAFRQDVVMLKEMIEQCGLGKVATLQGGEKFDLDLWNKPDTRVCVATEASGSSINHFGQVQYAIYFSQDFKWLSMQQSRGRTDRQNSEHDTCYYTYLHSDKSMDSRVYYTVRHSAQSEASLISKMEVQQWLQDVL